MEILVGYAKRELMVPQELSADDLSAANRQAAGWCDEVNAAVHSEICAVPAGRLDQERELLGALPSLRPEIGAKPISRKVDRLSCVRFGSARYSVPTRLIGTSVAISVLDGTVQDRVTEQLPAAGTGPPIGGQPLRRERPVLPAARLTVAAQLPADRGRAAAQLVCDRAHTCDHTDADPRS